MPSEELSQQVEALVNSLRGARTRNVSISLADVASVTEVLMGTMQAYFRSIDTAIYRECRELSDYLTNARKEIASLHFPEGNNSKIPRAGKELDAIVRATEEATHTIMTAAEEIMSADPSDPENYHSITQDSVMRIFEACSFQDITGQRISKVVETLSFIESRIYGLKDMLNVDEGDLPETVDHELEYKLEHGPALAGEGVDQDEIDAMLNGEISAEIMENSAKSIRHPAAAAARAASREAATDAGAGADPEHDLAPGPDLNEDFTADGPELSAGDIEALFASEPEPEPEPEAAPPVAEIVPVRPKAKPAPKAEPVKAESAETTQDDIDALFG